MSNPRPRRTSFDSPRLSVGDLRRSSPADPTRTLRLSEQEHRHSNTPPVLRLDELSLRPRSNPRSRTPRRFESPLDPAALRRDGLDHDSHSSDDENNAASRRVTIRPGAGMAIGSLPRRLAEEPRKTKSSKQGHSHRKLRRWNNDHFSGLAAELQASRGHTAAEALLKSQQDAHLYREVYDPLDKANNGPLHTFLNDKSLVDVRDQFFDGSLPIPEANHRRRHQQPRCRDNNPTAADQMNRIDNRLRKVVVQACRNSGPAASVVRRLEAYILHSFFGEPMAATTTNTWWSDLLLQPPTVITQAVTGRTVVQFCFDHDSPTGGFHRLLLHAVAQFHGLVAASQTLSIAANASSGRSVPEGSSSSKVKSRALLVTGRVIDNAAGGGKAQHRLLEHVTSATA